MLKIDLYSAIKSEDSLYVCAVQYHLYVWVVLSTSFHLATLVPWWTLCQWGIWPLRFHGGHLPSYVRLLGQSLHMKSSRCY